MKRPADEIKEIERHKYFLSEKRGHDVGWEIAEQDWEQEFGDEFRRRANSAATSCCSTSAPTSAGTESAASSCCQEPLDPQRERGRAEGNPVDPVVRNESPSRRSEGGPLRWLFSRLFQQQSSP